MGTLAQKLDKVVSTKEAIRQAIVSKGQTCATSVKFSDYPAKIKAITTGIDTSGATASASDILSGKTAYVNGSLISGTIATKAASDITVSGKTVSIPAGYYSSAITKTVGTVTQATPSIVVSSAGLITASATQSAGYVSAGTKDATKQLTTKAATTITPGTSAKTAVSSGYYTTGAIKVAGDANLIAANIKKGVSIFGVAGALAAARKVRLSYKTAAYNSITIANSKSGCSLTDYPTTMYLVMLSRIDGAMPSGKRILTCYEATYDASVSTSTKIGYNSSWWYLGAADFTSPEAGVEEWNPNAVTYITSTNTVIGGFGSSVYVGGEYVLICI